MANIVMYDEALVWEYVLVSFRRHLQTLLRLPEESIQLTVTEKDGKRSLATNILVPEDTDDKAKKILEDVLKQLYPVVREELIKLTAGLGEMRDVYDEAQKES